MSLQGLEDFLFHSSHLSPRFRTGCMIEPGEVQNSMDHKRGKFSFKCNLSFFSLAAAGLGGYDHLTEIIVLSKRESEYVGLAFPALVISVKPGHCPGPDNSEGHFFPGSACCFKCLDRRFLN